jgi:hypothetical protein
VDWDPHITAVAVNVTAVDPLGAGFFTTWSGDGPAPMASTLNYTRGAVIPNMAIVPVSWCDQCDGSWDGQGGYPAIAVTTNVDAHVIVDVLGVFDDAELGEGLRFTPLAPTRIADSRSGHGLPAALGSFTTGTVDVPGDIVTPGTYGLALNVTAVTPTAHGYVSVWPAGVSQPLVSNLNTAPGQTLPNSVYTLLGINDAFHVYNHAGSTHIIADVVGTIYYLPATGGPSFGPSPAPSLPHAGAHAEAAGTALLRQG